MAIGSEVGSLDRKSFQKAIRYEPLDIESDDLSWFQKVGFRNSVELQSRKYSVC